MRGRGRGECKKKKKKKKKGNEEKPVKASDERGIGLLMTASGLKILYSHRPFCGLHTKKNQQKSGGGGRILSSILFLNRCNMSFWSKFTIFFFFCFGGV